MFTPGQPIAYESFIDVRFGDIDGYGHVNSNFYIDYVNTARTLYQKRVLNLSDQFFLEKKMGFFVARVEINYRKPIPGVQRIFVTSQAIKIDGAFFDVEFKILSENKERLFSDGIMKLACVNLETNRSQPLPDWCLPYLYLPAE